MSQRSPTPEGVGDLLKQDSYDEEEDSLLETNEGSTADNLDSESAQAVEQSPKTTSEQGGPADKTPGKVVKKKKHSRSKNKQNANQKSFKGKGPARYFIIKSNIHANIDQSMANGIWATQKHNEDKLVEAFKSASHVYLIFSVNMSGHFQGYAKMTGLPFKHQPGVWEGGTLVSNSFYVEWIRRFDLPFKNTDHLTNPMNDDKPVKISRDGQEVPIQVGLELSRLFDEGADANGVPKPPKPVRNPNMRAGPAVAGPAPPNNRPNRMRRHHNMHNMMNNVPLPPGMPNGMVMTPMGLMLPHIAMQMGFSGMMGGGMNPAMMDPVANSMMGVGMDAMGMGGPPMGMHPSMNMGRMPDMMGNMNMPNREPMNLPKPPHMKGEYMDVMMSNHPFRNNRPMPKEPPYGRRSEEDMLVKAYEMNRRPSPSRHDKRYRSRSRSPSPRRDRDRTSRRHGRTRDSHEYERGRESLLDMSYEDYLEAYKLLRKSKKEKEAEARRNSMYPSMPNPMNPMMGQMGMMSHQSGPSSGMDNMNSMMGGHMGGSMMNPNDPSSMSEDQYLRVWENYSKMSGQPFDPQMVRTWYHQHKMHGK